jgi:alanine racemase
VTSRLTVDLGALAANYHTLRAAAGSSRCGAVVKADGYGLGAREVAARLATEGCTDFFVADAREATRLRPSIPGAALYVLTGATAATAAELAAVRAIPVLNHAAQLDCWRGRGPAAVHVDTGMNRLGFAPADARLERFAGVDVALLLTHLACADEPDHPQNRTQLETFATIAARFPGVPTSIGNSAATLNGAGWCGDLARPGIALYGGNPHADGTHPMRAVARLEAEVLQLREVGAGEAVGYGASWVARGSRLIATVGAGYAQGIPRLLSNVGEAAVGGVRVPYVGRVSMDLVTLDVSELRGRIATGDWVELMGAQVTVDEVAALSRTISYEILTGLAPCVPRRYVD